MINKMPPTPCFKIDAWSLPLPFFPFLDASPFSSYFRAHLHLHNLLSTCDHNLTSLPLSPFFSSFSSFDLIICTILTPTFAPALYVPFSIHFLSLLYLFLIITVIIIIIPLRTNKLCFLLQK